MDYMIGEPTVGTLVIASAGAGNQVEQVIAQRDASDKGVVFFWTASRGDKTTLPKLKASNIPIFYSPEKLARGLKFMLDYHAWRDSRATGGAAMPISSDLRNGVRQRTTVGVLRVKDDVIVLQTMMWPDEVRTPDFSVETGEVKDAEVKMANMLVETLAGDFDASEFEDDYAEAVEEMVKA